MVISAQQLELMSVEVLKNFEAYAGKHLGTKFPGIMKGMDRQEIDALVKEGIEKAADYYILDRRDVLVYLEYMVCFGKDFDTDPRWEWAGKILRIRNIPGTEKIERLYNIQKPQQDHKNAR